MSFNGYTVVDADSHIREYIDVDRTYREYIDPEYREPFEKLSAAVAKRGGRPDNQQTSSWVRTRSSSPPMSGARSESTIPLEPSIPRNLDSIERRAFLAK